MTAPNVVYCVFENSDCAHQWSFANMKTGSIDECAAFCMDNSDCVAATLYYGICYIKGICDRIEDKNDAILVIKDTGKHLNILFFIRCKIHFHFYFKSMFCIYKILSHFVDKQICFIMFPVKFLYII